MGRSPVSGDMSGGGRPVSVARTASEHLVARFTLPALQFHASRVARSAAEQLI